MTLHAAIRAVSLAAFVATACSAPATEASPKTRPATSYPKQRQVASGTLGKAVDLRLLDSTGKQVTLSRLWSKGGAIVVFYRGHW